MIRTDRDSPLFYFRTLSDQIRRVGHPKVLPDFRKMLPC